MAKHTPGPWRANPSINFSGTFDAWIGKDGNRTIAHAQIHDNVGSREECEANARLIATAPEMYEVLRELESYERRGLLGTHVHGAAQAIDATRTILAKIDDA